jgi:4-hydroxybenzoate polyprenyltransferase
MRILQLVQGIWRLIRGWNLLIVCLVFLLARHACILPVLELSGTPTTLGNYDFLMLMLATVLIAAGGNIINDQFDIRVDAINKPGRNIIGSLISANTTLTLYLFVTLSGIALAWFTTRKLSTQPAFIIFPVSAGLLYFYSSSYKHMMLVGNIVVAVLCAAAVFTSILFDSAAMAAEPLVTLITGYAVFAFLMTLAREIIKDCEDIEGDRAAGSRTLAVSAGPKTARRTAAAITGVVFLLLVWVQVTGQQWEDLKSFIYVSLFVDLPVLILIVLSLRATTAAHDRRNGKIAKLIMITGLLSMAVFYSSF